MMSVLTLAAADEAAPIPLSVLDGIEDHLTRLGGNIGEWQWLSQGKAADLPFDGLDHDQAAAAIAPDLADHAIDCFAQAQANRRKQLLICDMDATMISEESLDALAERAGIGERIAAITAKAMAGELDFADAVRERVAALKDLPESVLHEMVQAVSLNPGTQELVATMAANGARTALVSGGFTHFTEAVAERLGFHEHHANTLELEAGRLTGRVVEPIRNQNDKLKTLNALCGQLRLPLTAAMAVGDGANDVPMINAAGAGVAYRGKAVAKAAARFHLDHADFTALLYMQGYTEAEIIRPG